MALETERCSPTNASSPGPVTERRPGADGGSSSDKPRSAFHHIALLTRQDDVASVRSRDAESPSRDKISGSPDDRPFSTGSPSDSQRPFSRESLSPTGSLDQPRRNGFQQEPRRPLHRPDIPSSFSLVYGLIPRLPVGLPLPTVYHPDTFSRLSASIPKFSERSTPLFAGQSPERLYKVQTQRPRRERYPGNDNGCGSASVGRNNLDCNCCRSPTPPGSPPSPGIRDQQRQQRGQQSPGPSNSLTFSVDNILRPEFGRSALITSKPRTVKQSLSEHDGEGIGHPHHNHHHHHSHHNQLQQPQQSPQQPLQQPNQLQSPPLQRSSAKKISPAVSPAQKQSLAEKLASESSEDSSSKDTNEPLWPAWVYCTRYSDRPSSGKQMMCLTYHLL